MEIFNTAGSKTDVVARAKALLQSKDPKVRALVAKANAELMRLKDVQGTLHQDRTLDSISIQYANEMYIGTQLMPVVTVAKPSDKFYIYGKRDRLAVPEDLVLDRSTPNEVTENRTTSNFSTRPYALLDFVSERQLQLQDSPLNEMIDLVASVNEGLALKEEKRIATVLTTAANFPSQTTNITGTSQWADGAGVEGTTSNPIKDIQLAVRSIWQGYGPTRVLGYCSKDVFDALVRHSKMLDLTKYTTPGLAQKTLIAGALGLDDILVGASWEDTANEGAAASYSRIWGKHFGVIRVAQSPGIRTAAFGYTFRFGQKVTTQWYDPKPGTGGGYFAKVGLEEDHKIVASDTGYLLTNAIA